MLLLLHLTSSLQALTLWLVLVHRRDDVHRSGGVRVPGNAEEYARMVDEVDGKSVWFEGVLAPLGLSPAGATGSLSVDLAFGAFAGHILLEYRTRDLVCFDRRCSWAIVLGASSASSSAAPPSSGNFRSP